MEIIRLHILNINSLAGENTIDFTASPLLNVGIFAITGDTGAGKTTILDAITLALYGKVHRNKTVEDVMTNGTAECRAEIDFIQKDIRYKAKWSLRRSRSKIDGKIQGAQRQISQYNSVTQQYDIIAEKIIDVQTFIENITKLDFERFTRSVLLSQGDFSAFLKSKSQDKSILLEKITGTEIYSDISIAIFERDKHEKTLLTKIEDEIGFIEIMDTEAIDVLKNEITTLAETIALESNNVDNIVKKINVHTQITKLKNDKTTTESLLKENDQKSSDMRQEVEDLKRYNDLLPLKSDIEIAKQIQKRTSELEDENRIIWDKKSKISKELSEQELLKNKLLAQKDDVLKIFNPLDANYSKLVEQEVKIKTLCTQLEENKKEQAQSALKKNGLLKSITHLINLQEEEAQKLKDIIQKIEDNKICAQLDIEMPLLQNHLNTYNEISHNLKQKKEDKTVFIQALKTLNLELDQKTKSKDQLNKVNLIEGASNLTKEIANLNSKIIEAANKSNRLKTLLNLQLNGAQLDKEIKDLLEKKALKIKEKNLLSKQLKQDQALYTKLEKDTKRLELAYQQQIEINKYQASRAALSEGDKCPLCFSTEQPFRLENIETFEPEAAENFRKSKESLEKKQAEIYAQKTKESVLDAGLDVLQNALKTIEQKSLLALNEFDKMRSEKHNINSDIAQELKAIELQMSQDKASLTQKEAQHNQYEKFKVNIATLDGDIIQIKNKIELNNTQTKNLDSSIKALAKDAEKKWEEISKIAAPYALSSDKINTWLPLLEKYNSKYKKLVADKELLVKNQQLNIQDKALLDEKTKQINEKIKLDEEAYTKHKFDYKQTLDAYRKIYDGEDIKKDFETINHKKNTLNQKLENLALQTQKAKSSIQIYTEQLVILKANIKKQTLEKEQHLAKLKAALKKSNLPDLDINNLFIITTEEAEKTQKSVDQIKKDNHVYSAQLADIHKNIEALQNALKEDENLDNLILQRDNLQQDIKLKTLRTGQVNEILNKQKSLKIKFKEKTKLLKLQQEKCSHWSTLNDLIGSADGKKYRKYVQALTLKKLLVFANKHLQLFNERYFLTTNEKEELGMNIIDTIQANNIRSVHTLSGGETFLVSLALALGLSDIASKNTSIKSLFIDEGFGSLDEESLDMILSALENLQTQGKTIGLISHVKSLKERISTQIFIKKSNSGNSSVQLLC